MKTGIYIKNKKAFFEYEVLETYTAGIQLLGSEVKMIRDGKVSLIDSYCHFQEGELYVKNLLISESKLAFSHDPKRDKKLLLKKRELNKIQTKLIKGLTLIPVIIKTNERGLIKVDIILARGKKLYDKRQSIKEKDLKRKNNFVD